jgi:uncharacterized membrane protein YoaK (UPF0700 family)
MLNTVELNERVRALKPVQRLGYSTVVAVMIVAAFWLAIMLSVGLAALLVLLVIGGPLTLPDDIIALSLPMTIVFMFTVGLGIGGAGRVLSGQDVGNTIRRTVRLSLIVGLIAGAIFGAIWGILISANPLLFATILGLSLALPLALFRAVTCVVEPVSLRLVGGH